MFDTKNLVIALVLSLSIIAGWQHFYVKPKQEQLLAEQAQSQKVTAAQVEASTKAEVEERNKYLAENREARLPIVSDKLHGSFSLKGARFDDITLAEYRTTLDPSSPEVVLLSPLATESAFFASFGWLGVDNSVLLPDGASIWQADKATITPNDPVTLRWDNHQGQLFVLQLTLDNDYMFKVTQWVENYGENPVIVVPYGLINKMSAAKGQPFAILHEGPLGVFNGVLEEVPYKDLKNGTEKAFRGNKNGWVGITDKYWLAAIVPDQRYNFDAGFSQGTMYNREKYQVDYLGQKTIVKPNEKFEVANYFFAGAKKVALLDHYASTLNIPLFDRAIDFGWFYFLTKPLFIALKWLNAMLGNFGLAILLLTVAIKMALYPLAKKSYISMHKMKLIQPHIARLRERYQDDRLRFNQEVMEMYRREKINPLSGCLPIVVQIPVFFSLYKVLFVTIEMRHAPFYGWIKDLSAPDPTSLFNLFGLLPWSTPEFLTIGALPIIMGITMWMQQRMNPEPADPVQAKVMRFLPVLFVFMFHSFPAGLIIYWAWSNLLTVMQQWFITRSLKHKRDW